MLRILRQVSVLAEWIFHFRGSQGAVVAFVLGGAHLAWVHFSHNFSQNISRPSAGEAGAQLLCAWQREICCFSSTLYSTQFLEGGPPLPKLQSRSTVSGHRAAKIWLLTITVHWGCLHSHFEFFFFTLKREYIKNVIGMGYVFLTLAVSLLLAHTLAKKIVHGKVER